jgi:hypothetical protein
MSLALQIEPNQIAAAERLHGQLVQWRLSEKATESLKAKFPGFAPEEVLLKVTVINALYGTNIYAIVRLAEHVTNVMKEPGISSAGPELVERLAEPPPVGKGKKRLHLSFASKFAHFFVNAESYPIMDKYAVRMVRLHLGRGRLSSDSAHPYMAFARNYGILKGELHFPVSNRAMDHYLWLAGLYQAWQENRQAQINAEVRTLFEDRSAEVVADLTDLVPNQALRPQKRPDQP